MDAPKKETPLALIGVVLGLIGSVAGIWSQLDKRVQDRQLEELRAELNVRQDNRQERGAERDYLLKVTERVIDALGSPSTEKQKVAVVLVDTLSEGDVKAQLRSALLAVAPPDVKNRLQVTIEQERIFDNLQTAVQATPAKGSPSPAGTMAGINKQDAGTGIVRVDIFWCEGSNGPAHKQQADSLYSQAVASKQFGVVRVRPLPESVNRRPGYSIVSNLIRHQAEEKMVATQLQSLGSGTNFALQQIAYPTKDYISAFVCAAAG